LTTGQDYVEGRKFPSECLLFLIQGIDAWMAWNPCAAVFFHKTATRVRLYRDGRGPYHGIERPGRSLVNFAYVVARSDNRAPGYGRRWAGLDLGRSVIRIA
jgi:hypothetical protein